MNEAMAMPFLVDSEMLFRGLSTGDHIAFGLADVPGALLVVSIERLPR
jgi:Cu/Ag efflux protein CusF